MALYSSFPEAIGGTPLVRISRFSPGPAELYAKIEAQNPGGSVKDRVGRALIEAAEAAGVLQPGGTIIEPTSGNTGIGLALSAAVKGYRVILTMPETMSIERRRLLAAYGAEVVLTPGAEGMAGSIAKAEELHRAIPGSFIPQQFENPANPEIHERTTAQEILADLGGAPDVFVACIGTGGTFTGIGRALRAVSPETELIAVEPADSPLLSRGKAGPHALQGIGANFIPKILETALISRVITVTTEEAGCAAREIARCEGILCGISSGAALHAARTVAADPAYAGKRIAVLLPDGGERYLSTWLFNA